MPFLVLAASYMAQRTNEVSSYFNYNNLFYITSSGHKAGVDSSLSTRLYLSLAREFGVNQTILQVSLVLSVLLCVVLALVAQLFSRDMVQETEKKSSYECGFFPFDSATRLPFDVHFYVVGIMFLVFDVELIILTTIIILAATMPWSAYASVAGFIIILTVGFVYEWNCGALRWESKLPEPLKRSSISVTTASLVLPLFIAADISSYLELFFSYAFNFVSTIFCTFAVLGVLPFIGRRRKSIKLPGIYTWRRRSSPSTGIAPSWRPRFWRRRIEARRRLKGVRKFAKKQFETLRDSLLFVPKRWHGYRAKYSYFKRMRFLLRTRVVPVLHYHMARWHRLSLTILVSLFVIPTVCIPVPWILDDWEIALDDLVKLYKYVRGGLEDSLFVTYAFPTWLTKIITILLLYPVAVINFLCTYRWPTMVWLGLAVARVWYLFAMTSPWSSYRQLNLIKRLRRRARRQYRRKFVSAYWLFIESREGISPHPDAGQTDTLSVTKSRYILRFTRPPRQGTDHWSLLPLILVLPVLYLPEPFIDPTPMPPNLEIAYYLDRYWTFLVHDFYTLCSAFNSRTCSVALIILICSTIRGFTGILISPLRRLMHPRCGYWVLPPVFNALVLYLSLRGLVAWYNINSFPTVRSYILANLDPEKLSSPSHVASLLTAILLILAFILFIFLRRKRLRFWTGRQIALIRSVVHRRAARNRTFLQRAVVDCFDETIVPLVPSREQRKEFLTKKYKLTSAHIEILKRADKIHHDDDHPLNRPYFELPTKL